MAGPRWDTGSAVSGSKRNRAGRSLFSRLIAAPRRYTFDAAVRILTKAARTDDPAEAARFRTPSGMGFAPADVLEVRRGTAGKPEVTVSVMGLTGPSGVLPRHYTETVSQTLRNRSTALHEFLDMLSGRFIAFFARGGTKYRPARSAETALQRQKTEPDPITQALLSLTGFGTDNLTSRLGAGVEPLLHYAGLFTMRPRSAERLGAMLSDWLRMEVEIVEFAGAWLTLPADQQTRLRKGGAFCQIGVDAVAGVRVWNAEARILIRVGPLSLTEFDKLMPDQPAMQRLVSLVRTFVGMELGFAINPVLAGDAIPTLRLGLSSATPARLGWNTWTPLSGSSGTVRHAADDAVFEADIIEAKSLKLGRAA